MREKEREEDNNWIREDRIGKYTINIHWNVQKDLLAPVRNITSFRLMHKRIKDIEKKTILEWNYPLCP